MTRSRATARQAGAQMETWSVEYLRTWLADKPFGRFIMRRPKNGAKDRGDIANVELPDGRRLVIEVKNEVQTKLGPWLKEAEVERLNDKADACLVIHKRMGYGQKNMHGQMVTMTFADLIVMLGGERPSLGQEDFGE